MRALVTGSTGMLGSNLVRELVNRGWQVRALARSAEKAAKILGGVPNVEIVVGDMDHVAGFAPALDGVDVLFHTAAYFREYYGLGDHWAKLEQINIKASLELFTEADRRGVKKTIHTSSGGVVGKPTNGKPADETTPADGYVMQNLYFKSKLLLEQEIDKFIKSHRMPISMIRPGLILGPYDSGPTGIGRAIIEMLNGKLPAMPPGGFGFVDARDVAVAMIAMVDKGGNGERYLMPGEYHTMVEMLTLAAQSVGAQPPRFTMTPFIALTMARMSEFGARITRTDPMVPLEGIRSMLEWVDVSDAKARRELGITYRPFTETVRDAAVWFVQNGYVKKGSAALKAAQTAV